MTDCFSNSLNTCHLWIEQAQRGRQDREYTLDKLFYVICNKISDFKVRYPYCIIVEPASVCMYVAFASMESDVCTSVLWLKRKLWAWWKNTQHRERAKEEESVHTFVYTNIFECLIYIFTLIDEQNVSLIFFTVGSCAININWCHFQQHVF